MELSPTVQMLYEATKRISEASKEVFRLSKTKAETERIYRTALSQEMLKLRSEGMPATLIPDVSRGNVADLKFQRDAAMEMHRSALAAMEALKAEINALQSIAKYQSDI